MTSRCPPAINPTRGRANVESSAVPRAAQLPGLLSGLAPALLSAVLSGCLPSSPGPANVANAIDLELSLTPDDRVATPDLPRDPMDLALALADLSIRSDLADPYPAGPYGTAVGDVVPDFHFEGYYDVTGVWPATLLPFGDVSFRRLRGSGARYLFIATGSYW